MIELKQLAELASKFPMLRLEIATGTAITIENGSVGEHPYQRAVMHVSDGDEKGQSFEFSGVGDGVTALRLCLALLGQPNTDHAKVAPAVEIAGRAMPPVEIEEISEGEQDPPAVAPPPPPATASRFADRQQQPEQKKSRSANGKQPVVAGASSTLLRL